ncbi:phytoene/squalene synthase family protein [Waterburya agarophytonicola K14]|uniref:Phytoene/squalene synthase family protein n=1 Tax=Waterburya agarophytonicola KI4 TaxID=2874699 RepID=A0A964FFC1_9CYAN|nr:phytoene/squalene synthase family protein [Waterburya agarophytonicola]MCC0176756.1 phytoene/squalene synthase family protein [Waterburya agarophytonicola KI4]
MDFRNRALETLKQTSRTFYIPIARLPEKLQDAVASAYLCMRAIDEIEDTPDLDNQTKAYLLRNISLRLQEIADINAYRGIGADLIPYKDVLPEVSLSIGEWASLADQSIAPRIWDATAAMADRMAYWAERNWTISTKADLDRYTFSVAGAVGLLLSDLWAWYDGTETNRTQAIAFGRGLQAVNIVRNQGEDSLRGVSFIPDGWTNKDIQAYARRQLEQAALYIEALPKNSPALDFCQIPYVLAKGTLDAISIGKPKLSRHDVLSLVEKFTNIKSA